MLHHRRERGPRDRRARLVQVGEHGQQAVAVGQEPEGVEAPEGEEEEQEFGGGELHCFFDDDFGRVLGSVFGGGWWFDFRTVFGRLMVGSRGRPERPRKPGGERCLG